MSNETYARDIVRLIGLCVKFDKDGGFLMRDQALMDKYERKIVDLCTSVADSAPAPIPVGPSPATPPGAKR